MINFPKTGIPFILALICAGCTGTVFDSKRIDYRSAGKLPPLEVPPDLTQPKKEERFSIPDGKSTSYSAYNAERSGQAKSGNSDVLPVFPDARMERAGSERWVVVKDTPERLWPGIKDFWQEQGFIMKLEMPDVGVMETDWAENRSKIPQDGVRNLVGRVFDNLYSTAERDKYRTRLERGIVPGTTEIYVSHRGVAEVYTSAQKDQTRWQPRPPDPELEAEMLGRMLVRFGVQEERVKTLIANPPVGDRARLVENKDGADLLNVIDPFDRAWRRVGLALDRVGFTVEDRNREQGYYFVRYVDPEIDQRQAAKGFLSRLFTNADDKKALQYRIAVKDEKTTSQVQVQSKDGVVDKSPTGRKILALLFDQLK